MGTVGCYTLDVYCDHPQHKEYDPLGNPKTYTGQIEPECIRSAKLDGWVFVTWKKLNEAARNDFKGNGSGRAYCPVCSKHSDMAAIKKSLTA